MNSEIENIINIINALNDLQSMLALNHVESDADLFIAFLEKKKELDLRLLDIDQHLKKFKKV